MKTQHLIPILFLAAFCTASAQNTNALIHKATPETIIASIHKSGYDQYLALTEAEERSHDINQLLNIFKDAKATEAQKFAVVFYLGELRASEAVDEFAANITFHRTVSETYPLIFAVRPTISAALVKIGIPSIPAMIKNLEQSDDADARELSLNVLYSIEGDKDIVQLRLQKALVAQSDTSNKARIQAALKSLPEARLIGPDIVTSIPLPKKGNP